MTILDRFKAPTNSAKDKAKDARGRATDAAAKAKDRVSDALSDDAKRELTEALELILTKVRESATLAKLQDEAHRQLSDALELAREKVKEGAPAAKAKLQDAGHGVMQHLPHERRRRSKLRMLMMSFFLVPAVISVIVALKKKLGSRRKDNDDYDAGGELAWGETTYDSPVSSSSENAKPGNSVSAFTGAPMTAAAQPAASGIAVKANPTGVAMSDHEVEKPYRQDADTSERLNALLGKDVVDMDGHAIGQIERIYYRDGEGQPEWAVVSGGLLAEKKATVPLADATIDEKVQVSYSKELIESGIDFEADEVSIAQEMEADRHYNLRREAEAGASANSMLADLTTLRAWPAGFEKLSKK